jgi:uncharacterized membrane protein YhdT
MSNDKNQEASGDGNKRKRLLVKLFPIKFAIDNTRELIYAFMFLTIFAVTGLVFFGYITKNVYDVYHFTLWLYLVPLIIGLGFLHGVDKTFGVIPTTLLMFGVTAVLYAVVGFFAGPGLNLFIPLFYESLVFALHVTSLYLAVYLITYKKLNLRFKVIRTGEGFDKFTKLLEDMGFGKRMPDDLRQRLKDSGESPI